MEHLREELQESLRGIICAGRLWDKLEQVARADRKIRALLGNSRYTVLGTDNREKIFSKVHTEEKDCHSGKVDCKKEVVTAGR